MVRGWSWSAFGWELVAFRSWCILLFAFLGYFTVYGSFEVGKWKVYSTTTYLKLLAGCSVRLFVLWLGSLIVAMFLMGQAHLAFPYGSRRVSEIIFAIWAFVGGVTALIFVFSLAGFLSLLATRLCRLLVAVLAEGLYRLATHEKGPWEAFSVFCTVTLILAKVLLGH